MAPGRSKRSDGTIGDAAHRAQGSASDHNPDARGIVHAVDITNDPNGGMDTWLWAQVIRDRCRAGVERRVKYLVSHDGTKDVIASPTANWAWRQNGSVKHQHANHLHVSIYSTPQAEGDISRFFVSPIKDSFLMSLNDNQQAEVYLWLKFLFETVKGADTGKNLLTDIHKTSARAAVAAESVDKKVKS